MLEDNIEIEEERTVEIKNPNQVTKDHVTDTTRSRVHPGSHDYSHL